MITSWKFCRILWEYVSVMGLFFFLRMIVDIQNDVDLSSNIRWMWFFSDENVVKVIALLTISFFLLETKSTPLRFSICQDSLDRLERNMVWHSILQIVIQQKLRKKRIFYLKEKEKQSAKILYQRNKSICWCNQIWYHG